MTHWIDAAVVLAQGSDSPPPPAGMEAFLVQFGPIILIVIAFFWLMHRSQKKKDRTRQEMLDSIQPKDRVVTIGGMHGRVLEVKEDVFVLRVDDDVKISVSRGAVSRKAADEPTEQEGV